MSLQPGVERIAELERKSPFVLLRIFKGLVQGGFAGEGEAAEHVENGVGHRLKELKAREYALDERLAGGDRKGGE